MKARVETCRLRRDGQYLVIVKSGPHTFPGLSPVPVREGSDVRYVDGKVVAK